MEGLALRWAMTSALSSCPGALSKQCHKHQKKRKQKEASPPLDVRTGPFVPRSSPRDSSTKYDVHCRHVKVHHNRFMRHLVCPRTLWPMIACEGKFVGQLRAAQ